jgi:hypothetical protein
MLRKRVKRLVHSLLGLLANLLLAWLELLRALPLAKAIIGRRVRFLCKDRPRRDSARRCIPVHEKVYRRPDPLIYSQQYLMAQGLAVTWDNPDISIRQAGVAVLPHALLPDTDYEIVARIWNGSTNAPAVHLPVRFSYLSFGIGTLKNAIDETFVNLGAKGSPSCPAFASVKWRTPNAPGHYCLQVELLWSEDANPLNNLGQTNTDVQPLSSPEATFVLAVGNDAKQRRLLRFEADGYEIPPRFRSAPICRRAANPRRPGGPASCEPTDATDILSRLVGASRSSHPAWPYFPTRRSRSKSGSLRRWRISLGGERSTSTDLQTMRSWVV